MIYCKIFESYNAESIAVSSTRHWSCKAVNINTNMTNNEVWLKNTWYHLSKNTKNANEPKMYSLSKKKNGSLRHGQSWMAFRRTYRCCSVFFYKSDFPSMFYNHAQFLKLEELVQALENHKNHLYQFFMCVHAIGSLYQISSVWVDM